MTRHRCRHPVGQGPAIGHREQRQLAKCRAGPWDVRATDQLADLRGMVPDAARSRQLPADWTSSPPGRPP
ncbi:hypothetical protein V6U90_25425 [Micromonospora sp. CPCC 206060]|uniref:hypothetical protein n=1 Tax=Micromonospora sp. CPCC 206060 TaxID=3122406 RepID=UPI002FF1363A